MKLNLDMLRAAAVGAARITENARGFHFYRFTEEQENYYGGTGNHAKTLSSAGIRLRFKTDSRKLSLSVNTERASTRTFFAFDVFANGKKAGSVTNIPEGGITFEEGKLMPGDAMLPLGRYSGAFDLGEGEKTVEVYFPWSVISTLISAEIDDGASFEGVHYPLKMISYGDSITHGYDAFSPANAYSSVIADGLMADAINKGIGGERFCPYLAGLRDDIEPDIITVAYGTNDWCGLERETFETRCYRFYEALSSNYPNAKIFALTPIWRRDGDMEKPCGTLASVRDYIADMENRFPNVTAISCEDFVPKDPKYFSDLRLHPNDEGFVFYGKALAKEIKKHL